VNLEQCQRLVNADPQNLDARVALIQAQARISGPNIYLQPLNDIDLWESCPEPIQDLAISEVAGRLTDFEYLETRQRSCPHTRNLLGIERADQGLVTRRSTRQETLGFRLPSFRHKTSQMILTLLPGNPSLAPFLIGRWGVTNSRQRGLLKTQPETDSSLPLTALDWTAARALLSGWQLRLPSASEWTYACRAQTNSAFFWGDNFDDRFVWHKENSQGQLKSFEVHEATQSWNPFGLIDMIGNTWEWVDLPLEEGGFLEEAKLLGDCCFESEPGDPPDFWFDGKPTQQIGFRAAATIPNLPFDKNVKIVIRPSSSST
jgi:hypothetical protein